jgi:hypothetical protein
VTANPPTVWFFNVAPPDPGKDTTSNPNSAFPLYPSCVSTNKGYVLIEEFAVLFCQVDELPGENSPPLKAAQFGGVPAPHPSGRTTSV